MKKQEIDAVKPALVSTQLTCLSVVVYPHCVHKLDTDTVKEHHWRIYILQCRFRSDSPHERLKKLFGKMQTLPCTHQHQRTDPLIILFSIYLDILLCFIGRFDFKEMMCSRGCISVTIWFYSLLCFSPHCKNTMHLFNNVYEKYRTNRDISFGMIAIIRDESNPIPVPAKIKFKTCCSCSTLLPVT